MQFLSFTVIVLASFISSVEMYLRVTEEMEKRAHFEFSRSGKDLYLCSLSTSRLEKLCIEVSEDRACSDSGYLEDHSQQNEVVHPTEMKDNESDCIKQWVTYNYLHNEQDEVFVRQCPDSKLYIANFGYVLRSVNTELRIVCGLF